MKYEVYQLSDGTYSIRPSSDGVVDGVTIFADAARAMIAANKLNDAQKTDEEETTMYILLTLKKLIYLLVNLQYIFIMYLITCMTLLKVFLKKKALMI